MPENTGVGLKHIFDWVVAENVDALKMRLVKSKKLLKKASKSQTKLLTWLMKQKMTLEKTCLSKKVRDDFEGAQPNNCTVGSGEDHHRQTHCRHHAHRGSARGLSLRMRNPVPQGGALTRSQEQKTPQLSPHRTGRRRIHMTSR